MTRSRRSNRILRLLFWETTVRCNLTCAHCRRLESDAGAVNDLSTGQVKVIFAAAHRTNADRVIRERVRKGNPGQYTVVSSDHEVQNAAYATRMAVLTSQAFADKMLDTMTQQPPATEVAPEVSLSKAEVDEWLHVFGQSVDD